MGLFLILHEMAVREQPTIGRTHLPVARAEVTGVVVHAEQTEAAAADGHTALTVEVRGKEE
jgi:hypothetical protein